MKSYSDTNSYLPTANAQTDSIDEAWTGSNEQWWNWYISLADNSQEHGNREKLIPRPEQVVQKVPSIEELEKELAKP